MRFHFPLRIPHFALRTLDRYAVGEWLRVFLITLLGFPVLVLVIDLTDKLDQYLGRGIKPAAVALSYVFYFPELMFLILPVAVLFATVFTVGALDRHSELTAAKASGISFHRVVRPLFLAAGTAFVVGLLLGEIAPVATSRRMELLGEKAIRSTSSRYNFVYRADGGWVYAIRALELRSRELVDLLAEPKAPDEMRYGELRRYIDALVRSGSNAKKLQVELALKIAIPFICLLIALFGAPLAISSPKSGAAWGVAASLATTFIVLLMFQLAKAVGAGGVLPPMLAAWTPNLLVGVAAVYLLRKAPT